jgi:hypothetical protein
MPQDGISEEEGDFDEGERTAPRLGPSAAEHDNSGPVGRSTPTGV